MNGTKKWLITKAKNEYFRDYLWMDIDIMEFREFIKTIKNCKSKKELDKIAFNLFHY